MQIEIGGFIFATKKAASDAIRQILHTTQHRTPLAGDAAELIHALLGQHPDAAEKIGPGVASIEVRAIDYGKPGFWVTRTDGTTCDFSYRRALSGAEPHPAQVKRAMRSAVRDQIDEFRATAFEQAGGVITCPLTAQRLEPGRWVHVDHIVDFATIASVYVSIAGGYDQIRVESFLTHPGPALIEPWLSTWRQFHAEHAQLRVVHKSANLARYKKVSA